MNEELTAKSADWIKCSGRDSGLILATRVRLARNFPDMKFAHYSSSEEKINANKRITAAVNETEELSSEGSFYDLSAASEKNRRFFYERGLVPAAEKLNAYQQLFVEQGENYSILTNCEDHLRIQSLANGLELKKAYTVANKVESAVESKLDFAFDSEYGYITSSPDNLGTGMMASFMAHLPVLMWRYQHKFEDLMLDLLKNGFTVRGTNGGESESEGDIIQVSNQITLGVSENSILSALNSFAKRLIKLEMKARSKYQKKERAMLEDKIFRSLYIMRAARSLTYKEMLSLISWTRVGMTMGYIKPGFDDLNMMFLFLKNMHLMKKVDENEEDPGHVIYELRASLVRKAAAKFEEIS